MSHIDMEFNKKMNHFRSKILKKYPRLRQVNDNGVNIIYLID